MSKQYLYEKMETRRDDGYVGALPEYISLNLNQRFELRTYQDEAMENFAWYFESEKRPFPIQVLFNMATGSGKTLIMAGLIIYLYKKGYRDFLFFVNLSTIVKKTKDNFLNCVSKKYLFAQDIVIDGRHVRIQEVNNFQDSSPDAINIYFTTTQGLLADMYQVKEGAMTPDDFEERKVVFISDEAHHLNVDTKNTSKEEEDNHHTWEETVNNLFYRNTDNVLLEFTATCDLGNKAIEKEYKDKIIYCYDLSRYYNDKFSKAIQTLSSNMPLMDRVLQALVLSQYRLKVFQAHNLDIKPVVLFKSAKIKDSSAFMEDFLHMINTLTGDRLLALSKNTNTGIMQRAYKYFDDHNISFDMLAAELRDDFSAEHCISANNDKDVEQHQNMLNSLEEHDNPYRAIFEVKKLDEGWDVLNLFDIVRLYDTKKGNKTTIAEAQLIGRGARYCPFRLNDEQPKYQRKYDDDINNEMRVCEELYYHCINDNNYIKELHSALQRIGLKDSGTVTRKTYKLKEGFKNETIYQSGVVFANERRPKNRTDVKGLPGNIKTRYNYWADLGESITTELMGENLELQTSDAGACKMTIKEIAEVNYAIVNKALMKYPAYDFDRLKACFPRLGSTKEFIKDYLKNIEITFQNTEKPSIGMMYDATFFVLGQMESCITEIGTTYEGTKKFKPHYIKDVFHDKTVEYTNTHNGGIGFSQNDGSVDPSDRVDLSKEDWFAYVDNFGTSEEKAFVAYFKKQIIKKLQKEYDKIYLIRNERELCIYSFDDGQRFEPDYILFLQKEKENVLEQMQIFVEPKGDMLIEKDSFKEKFLLRLEKEANPITLTDDNKYKIWGVHFFNRNNRAKEFEEDIKKLMSGNSF